MGYTRAYYRPTSLQNLKNKLLLSDGVALKLLRGAMTEVLFLGVNNDNVMKLVYPTDRDFFQNF